MPFSVFVDTERPLEEAVGVLGQVLGRELVRDDDPQLGPIYRAHAMYLDWACYGDHGFEDDGDVELSKYTLALTFAPYRAGLATEGFESMVETLARFLAARLSGALGCRAIVVWELVKLKATFEKGSAVG